MTKVTAMTATVDASLIAHASGDYQNDVEDSIIVDSDEFPSNTMTDRARDPNSSESAAPDDNKKTENEDEGDEFMDGFMRKVFDTTVDAPCRSVRYMPESLCQINIEEQLDLFSHCRRPDEFLSFFREHHTSEGVDVQVMPAGAYVVPTFCEYCQAPHISKCTTTCERPKLFFQKKRPPFAKKDPLKWDPDTDDAIMENILVQSSTNDALETSRKHSKGWVNDCRQQIFGGNDTCDC